MNKSEVYSFHSSPCTFTCTEDWSLATRFGHAPPRFLAFAGHARARWPLLAIGSISCVFSFWPGHATPAIALGHATSLASSSSSSSEALKDITSNINTRQIMGRSKVMPLAGEGPAVTPPRHDADMPTTYYTQHINTNTSPPKALGHKQAPQQSATTGRAIIIINTQKRALCHATRQQHHHHAS